MKPSELPDLPAHVTVAVDTETSGLHPDDPVLPVGPTTGNCRVAVVSIAWVHQGDVVTMAFPFDQGTRDKLDQGILDLFGEDPNLPEEEWRALLGWLDGRRLCFHNAKFDLMMLRAGTRHWPGRDLEHSYVWDTALAAHIIWPQHRIGLEDTARRLKLAGADKKQLADAVKEWVRGAKLGKGIGTKDNPRYDLAPWEIIEPYAAGDTELTILLYHQEQAELDVGVGSRELVDREIALSRTLYHMETRGVGFDRAGCQSQAAVVRAKMDKIAAGLPFVPSVNGAKAYYFGELGITPTHLTDGGKPQLTDEVRRLLQLAGHPHVREYDQYVKLDKALSMWYGGWPHRVGDDGRLRCTFRQAHVKSGRLSVERIQLQAIPKDDKEIDGVVNLREFFVPRDGYSLWNLDLSQAELRLASHFAPCPRMLEMLAGGADIHGITTEQIFGIQKGHPEWKVKRDIAKRLTFGGIFQIGAKTFQHTLSKLAGIDWTLHQCKEAVGAWRDLYPEFGDAYSRYDRLADRQGWIKLANGEKSYFGQMDYSNSAWNRRVQGSLAVFLKEWLPRVDAETDGALVLTVHDSTVLELPLLMEHELVPGGEDDGLVHPEALAVAERGSAFASDMFGTYMPIDTGVWRKSQKHFKPLGAQYQ